MIQNNEDIKAEWKRIAHELHWSEDRGNNPNAILNFWLDKINDREREYRDALIWCSGSDDFQVGGKAREGWEKICKPLLA